MNHFVKELSEMSHKQVQALESESERKPPKGLTYSKTPSTVTNPDDGLVNGKERKTKPSNQFSFF